MSTSTPVCVVCGERIQGASKGRPRRYCSGRCRTEAWRDRTASTFFEEGMPTPAPAAEPIVRAELLEVADLLITGAASAPPEEQLTRAVIETKTLATQYRRLEPHLPKGLAWRAGEASKRLDEAVEDLFTPHEGDPE